MIFISLYFGLKYKLIILVLGGDRHHFISSAHAEHTQKFLMHMLSARIQARAYA
jgi:hypothetical protein